MDKPPNSRCSAPCQDVGMSSSGTSVYLSSPNRSTLSRNSIAGRSQCPGKCRARDTPSSSPYQNLTLSGIFPQLISHVSHGAKVVTTIVRTSCPHTRHLRTPPSSLVSTSVDPHLPHSYTVKSGAWMNPVLGTFCLLSHSRFGPARGAPGYCESGESKKLLFTQQHIASLPGLSATSSRVCCMSAHSSHLVSYPKRTGNNRNLLTIRISPGSECLYFKAITSFSTQDWLILAVCTCVRLSSHT